MAFPPFLLTAVVSSDDPVIAGLDVAREAVMATAAIPTAVLEAPAPPLPPAPLGATEKYRLSV